MQMVIDQASHLMGLSIHLLDNGMCTVYGVLYESVLV